MRTLLIKISLLLAVLPLAALAAGNDSTIEPSPLPEPVAAAITTNDCELLTNLHRRYREDSVDHAPEVHAALTDAILRLPGCSQVDAVLLRVEPMLGVDFFDPAQPINRTSTRP